MKAKGILTRTRGFLDAFTHSLNPYVGCSYGGALCGRYCYAPAVMFKKEWGGPAEPKENAAELYAREIGRERRRGPVRIFMASVTDPYVPEERRRRITRAVLEAMVDDPPDFVAVQTHATLARRDLDLLAQLPCALQISIESDRERFEGLPPPAATVADRLSLLGEARARGIATVGVVAPLLPLDDAHGFARRLDAACDRIIVDHWRIGDGSPGGTRTKRRGWPAAMERIGFGRWNEVDAMNTFVETARAVLGSPRVGVSREGFSPPPDGTSSPSKCAGTPPPCAPACRSEARRPASR